MQELFNIVTEDIEDKIINPKLNEIPLREQRISNSSLKSGVKFPSLGRGRLFEDNLVKRFTEEDYEDSVINNNNNNNLANSKKSINFKSRAKDYSFRSRKINNDKSSFQSELNTIKETSTVPNENNILSLNDNQQGIYNEEDRAILSLYNIDPDTEDEKKRREHEWYDKKYPDSPFNYSKGGNGPIVFYQFKYFSNEEIIQKYKSKNVNFNYLKLTV
jgi:hypothetical protein